MKLTGQFRRFLARTFRHVHVYDGNGGTAYCIWSDNRSFSNRVQNIQFLTFPILIVDLNSQRYEVHLVDQST